MPEASTKQYAWRSIVQKIARIYSVLPFMDWLTKHLFILDGRISRWEFFKNSSLATLICIAYFILSCVLAYISTDVFHLVSETTAVIAGFVFCVVIYLPLFVGNILIMRARLHDVNASGWWYFLSIIPYIHIVFDIAILLIPGTTGANQYGDDPLASEKSL